MRVLLLFAALIGLLIPSANADPTDLTGGVFIAHYPAALQFSSDPPPEGWCHHYNESFALEVCEEQVNRVDTPSAIAWFVLAAWDEEKEWCGTQFGFDSYGPGIFGFVDWGPCYPVNGIEFASPGWPGPNEGTACVTSSTDTWSGNLVPVYFFAGYAYAEGILSLAPDPRMGFGGTANCPFPPSTFSAARHGGLGLFTDGIAVCPHRKGGSPTSLDNTQQLPEIAAQCPFAFRASRGAGATSAFSFNLGKDAHVSLIVFDATGRVVRCLLEGHTHAGSLRIEWGGRDQSGKDVPSGVYFAQFHVDRYPKGRAQVVIVR